MRIRSPYAYAAARNRDEPNRRRHDGRFSRGRISDREGYDAGGGRRAEKPCVDVHVRISVRDARILDFNPHVPNEDAAASKFFLSGTCILSPFSLTVLEHAGIEICWTLSRLWFWSQAEAGSANPRFRNGLRALQIVWRDEHGLRGLFRVHTRVSPA